MIESQAEILPLSGEVRETSKQSQRVGLDFETYCDMDLTKVGLHNYINHESFRVLGFSAVEGTGLYPALVSSIAEEDFNPAEQLRKLLYSTLPDARIAAHNASFEYAVCARIGLHIPYKRFIDTAVAAAAHGYSRSLAASSAQATQGKKLEVGLSLIKRFSIPNKENNFSCPTYDWIHENDERLSAWNTFIYEYCRVDSEQSLALATTLPITPKEQLYSLVTHNMNLEGWPVDTKLAKEFLETWERNKDEALYNFTEEVKAPDFNINSVAQLRDFCAERGVKLTSFDEQHVDTYLTRIDNKMRSMRLKDPKAEQSAKYMDYNDVRMLLETKQILGGASLRKLEPLLRQVGEDGRLYDQYLHCGAQQTFRTSGRGVQMQNIKRLGVDLLDVDDPTIVAEATNATLAANMRQLFAPKERTSELIVGDFSSVESRGLAWLAGAHWKLDAYAKGKDLYKVLAAEMFHKDYDNITKEERKVGKVGELSCGYGAGAGAVSTFAAKMGMDMSNNETAQLVRDWRAANPEVVTFWGLLDSAIESALTTGQVVTVPIGPDPQRRLSMRLSAKPAPDSLLALHPGSQTLEVTVANRASGCPVFTRLFHGCYKRGRNWCYYKPTSRKTGDLWDAHYTDPGTLRKRYYDIYGGKLAGILTQSFCREIFMTVAVNVQSYTDEMSHVRLIGQFHDELVIEADLANDKFGEVKQATVKHMKSLMSMPIVYDDNLRTIVLDNFPLTAEVNSAYRYIK